MDLGIKGKSYIVVGGSRGMGWETVRVLAEDGANVAIISRNPDPVRGEMAELADRCGVRITGYAADVMKSGPVDVAVAEAIKGLGPIRGLAITNFVASRSADFVDSQDEEWDSFYQDVLMGTVRSCRAILPHLLEQGGGNLVITGAYSARAPKGYLFAYASLKAAVINMTKNLAKTYGPQGIRANCVCPGAIETERSKARLDAFTAAEGIPRREAERKLLGEVMKMSTAMQRLGQASEIGDMIAFLLSERSAYTNGLIANVDGGTDF